MNLSPAAGASPLLPRGMSLNYVLPAQFWKKRKSLFDKASVDQTQHSRPIVRKCDILASAKCESCDVIYERSSRNNASYSKPLKIVFLLVRSPSLRGKTGPEHAINIQQCWKKNAQKWVHFFKKKTYHFWGLCSQTHGLRRLETPPPDPTCIVHLS